MNFIERDGQETISHFDLAVALRIEAKTVKYHVTRRLQALQAFGEVVEDSTGRHTFFLNKKQALLLMTFVSNNSEAKIFIINRVIDSVTPKHNEEFVNICKTFVDKINPIIHPPKQEVITATTKIEPVLESIIDPIEVLPEDAQEFMDKVESNI